MILNKDVELVDGLAIAHIRSMSALVLSDMHLGYESHMARSGFFIPKVNLKRIIENLENALDKTGAKSIIVVGDIKNEFSGVEQDEFNELYEIIEFCKRKRVELILVKGNHDNFIERYKEPFKLKTYESEMHTEGYLFFHGDKLPRLPSKRPKMLIAGHEHPSIGVINSAGRKERLRCFLLGKYRGMDLLVLPAISYFAAGSDINLQSRKLLMSPVLRHIEIDEAHAIAIGYGSTIDFGLIGDLRRLHDRQQ